MHRRLAEHVARDERHRVGIAPTVVREIDDQRAGVGDVAHRSCELGAGRRERLEGVESQIGHVPLEASCLFDPARLGIVRLEARQLRVFLGRRRTSGLVLEHEVPIVRGRAQIVGHGPREGRCIVGLLEVAACQVLAEGAGVTGTLVGKDIMSLDLPGAGLDQRASLHRVEGARRPHARVGGVASFARWSIARAASQAQDRQRHHSPEQTHPRRTDERRICSYGTQGSLATGITTVDPIVAARAFAATPIEMPLHGKPGSCVPSRRMSAAPRT